MSENVLNLWLVVQSFTEHDNNSVNISAMGLHQPQGSQEVCQVASLSPST